MIVLFRYTSCSFLQAGFGKWAMPAFFYVCSPEEGVVCQVGSSLDFVGIVKQFVFMGEAGIVVGAKRI